MLKNVARLLITRFSKKTEILSGANPKSDPAKQNKTGAARSTQTKGTPLGPQGPQQSGSFSSQRHQDKAPFQSKAKYMKVKQSLYESQQRGAPRQNKQWKRQKGQSYSGKKQTISRPTLTKQLQNYLNSVKQGSAEQQLQAYTALRQAIHDRQAIDFPALQLQERPDLQPAARFLFEQESKAADLSNLLYIQKGKSLNFADAVEKDLPQAELLRLFWQPQNCNFANFKILLGKEVPADQLMEIAFRQSFASLRQQQMLQIVSGEDYRLCNLLYFGQGLQAKNQFLTKLQLYWSAYVQQQQADLIALYSLFKLVPARRFMGLINFGMLARAIPQVQLTAGGIELTRFCYEEVLQLESNQQAVLQLSDIFFQADSLREGLQQLALSCSVVELACQGQLERAAQFYNLLGPGKKNCSQFISQSLQSKGIQLQTVQQKSANPSGQSIKIVLKGTPIYYTLNQPVIKPYQLENNMHKALQKITKNQTLLSNFIARSSTLRTTPSQLLMTAGTYYQYFSDKSMNQLLEEAKERMQSKQVQEQKLQKIDEKQVVLTQAQRANFKNWVTFMQNLNQPQVRNQLSKRIKSNRTRKGPMPNQQFRQAKQSGAKQSFMFRNARSFSKKKDDPNDSFSGYMKNREEQEKKSHVQEKAQVTKEPADGTQEESRGSFSDYMKVFHEVQAKRKEQESIAQKQMLSNQPKQKKQSTTHPLTQKLVSAVTSTVKVEEALVKFASLLNSGEIPLSHLNQLVDSKVQILGSINRALRVLFFYPIRGEQSRLSKIMSLNLTYDSANGQVQRDYNSALTHSHFKGPLPESVLLMLLNQLKSSFKRTHFKALTAHLMRYPLQATPKIVEQLIQIGVSNNSLRVIFDYAFWLSTSERAVGSKELQAYAGVIARDRQFVVDLFLVFKNSFTRSKSAVPLQFSPMRVLIENTIKNGLAQECLAKTLEIIEAYNGIKFRPNPASQLSSAQQQAKFKQNSTTLLQNFMLDVAQFSAALKCSLISESIFKKYMESNKDAPLQQRQLIAGFKSYDKELQVFTYVQNSMLTNPVSKYEVVQVYLQKAGLNTTDARVNNVLEQTVFGPKLAINAEQANELVRCFVGKQFSTSFQHFVRYLLFQEVPVSGSTKVLSYKVMNKIKEEGERPKLKAILDILFDSRLKLQKETMVAKYKLQYEKSLQLQELRYKQLLKMGMSQQDAKESINKDKKPFSLDFSELALPSADQSEKPKEPVKKTEDVKVQPQLAQKKIRRDQRKKDKKLAMAEQQKNSSEQLKSLIKGLQVRSRGHHKVMPTEAMLKYLQLTKTYGLEFKIPMELSKEEKNLLTGKFKWW